MKLAIPIDVLVGISRTNRRLLELPTVLSERTAQGCKTLRLEFCVLLNVVIICDYRIVHIFSGAR